MLFLNFKNEHSSWTMFYDWYLCFDPPYISQHGKNTLKSLNLPSTLFCVPYTNRRIPRAALLNHTNWSCRRGTVLWCIYLCIRSMKTSMCNISVIYTANDTKFGVWTNDHICIWSLCGFRRVVESIPLFYSEIRWRILASRGIKKLCPMLKYSDTRIYDIWEPITIVIFNESLQTLSYILPVCQCTLDKNVT